jgi:hypothetical protein
MQPEEYQNTIESLKENTYVDNLMKTGSDITDLEDYKREATEILGDAKFPVHKWESNVEELDNESIPAKYWDINGIREKIHLRFEQNLQRKKHQ